MAESEEKVQTSLIDEKGTAGQPTPEGQPQPAAAPEKSEEPKVDADPKISKESREEVEASRDYYQTGYQEAVKRQKEMETALMEAGFSVPEYEKAPPQQPQPEPSTAPAPVKEDQFDEGDADPMTVFNQHLQAMENRMLKAIDQRDRTREQQHQQQVLAREQKRVETEIKEFVDANKIPEKVWQAAYEKANKRSRGVLWNVPGGPTEMALMATDYMTHTLLEGSLQQRTAGVKADAARKIEEAKNAAQPIGASPGTPPPVTDETLNDQLADEIAPDDT